MSQLRKLCRSRHRTEERHRREAYRLDLALFLSTHAKTPEHEPGREKLRQRFQRIAANFPAVSPKLILARLEHAFASYVADEDGKSQFMRFVEDLYAHRTAEHGIAMLD